MIAVPPGECYPTMTDTQCPAEWCRVVGARLTDESYSASASSYDIDPLMLINQLPRSRCQSSCARNA